MRAIRVNRAQRLIISALAMLAAGAGVARAQQSTGPVAAQDAAAESGCQGAGSGKAPGVGEGTPRGETLAG